MMDNRTEGHTQEQATEIITKATEELQKTLGDGTRIVVIASRGTPGTWGYCWSVRGDAVGVLGILTHAGEKIKEWIKANLG